MVHLKSYLGLWLWAIFFKFVLLCTYKQTDKWQNKKYLCLQYLICMPKLCLPLYKVLPLLPYPTSGRDSICLVIFQDTDSAIFISGQNHWLFKGHIERCDPLLGFFLFCYCTGKRPKALAQSPLSHSPLFSCLLLSSWKSFLQVGGSRQLFSPLDSLLFSLLHLL